MLWVFMLLALPWDLFSRFLFGGTYAQFSKADVVAMPSNFSGLHDAVSTSGRRLEYGGDNNMNDKDYSPSSVVSTIMTAILGMFLYFVIPPLAGCISQCVFLCVYKQNVHDKREPLTPNDNDAIQDTNDSDNATDVLDVKFKLFGCFEDMDVCLHGTFCQICRVADTWGTAKVFEFCLGIFVFLLASQVSKVVCFVLLIIFSPLFPDQEKTVDADVEQWLSERNSTEEANQAVRDILGKEESSPVEMLLLCFSVFMGFIVQSGLFGLLRTQLREKVGGRKRDNKLLLKDALIWGLCPCCATIQEARVVDELNGVHVACCCKLEQTGGSLLVGEVTAVAH